MNRALRAATTGVLLLSPVALTACSAGQVTQTATQDRDKTGAMADLGDLALRDVRLAYPINGVYQQGGDARLVMAVANSAEVDDTLLSITGEGFEGVEVVQSSTAGAAAAPSGSGGSAEPGAVDITVPAESNVYIGGDGPVVTLTGLTEELTPALALPVTLTFERAGEVTIDALVGTSQIDLPRGEAFDFHEGEEGPEEAARERETGGGDATDGAAEPSGEAANENEQESGTGNG